MTCPDRKKAVKQFQCTETRIMRRLTEQVNEDVHKYLDCMQLKFSNLVHQRHTMDWIFFATSKESSWNLNRGTDSFGIPTMLVSIEAIICI